MSTDRIAEYYAQRAPEFDASAGYTDPVAEERRAPIKAGFRRLLRGHDVLEVACGTGYWTAVVAETARSVLATDINPPVLAIARERCRLLLNVEFMEADAYSLEGVPGDFTAACSFFWWELMPRERVRPFLLALHSKLAPGALVLFADHLPYEGRVRRENADGDTIEERVLRDGRHFEVVKNFYTRQQIAEVLRDMAIDMRFGELPGGKGWRLIYRARAGPPTGEVRTE